MATRAEEFIDSMNSEMEEPNGGVPPENDGGAQDAPPEENPKHDEGGAENHPKDKPEDPQKPGDGDDRFSRAEFSFRRKIDKMNRKHADDIAERDAKYNELLKQFEELKKSVAPKDEAKTREQFANDDEYIDYLTERRVNKILAERDGKDAERRAKEAEEQKKAKEAEAELVESQQKWLGHVDKCFGEDEQRKQKFLSKIQYASRNGLGEILDACPVASDFLMNNPNGPKVFEKMLNDKDTFVRVFNESAGPLDIYYELRNIERELSADQQNGVAATQKRQTMPNIGKPGKQAGGGSKPDIFSDRDAMINFIRSR